MELLSTQFIFGLLFFLMGILISISCNFAEWRNYCTIKKRRTPKPDGQRKLDSEATRHYDHKRNMITLGGVALSLIGTIQLLRSIIHYLNPL